MAGQTKDKILIAARRVFAEKGYKQATIKDISVQAGAAPGLVHYHFKNKEDLLIQVMKSLYEGRIGPAALDQLGAQSPAELATAIKSILRDALQTSPEFFQLIYGTLDALRQSATARESMEHVWAGYRKQSEATINRLKEDGVIASSLPAGIILTLIISMLHGIGIQHIGEPNLDLTQSDELWRAIEDSLLYILERG